MIVRYSLIFALTALGACAPSPLYVGQMRVGTGGNIPRDGRGEPIWAAIPPTPAGAILPGQPLPPAPAVLPLAVEQAERALKRPN